MEDMSRIKGEDFSAKISIPGCAANIEPLQAKRFNEGKPQLGYLRKFGKANIALAQVFENGTKTYGRDNWLKGFGTATLMDCIDRHIQAYASGQTEDPMSGLHPLAHAAWNVMALLKQELEGYGERDF